MTPGVTVSYSGVHQAYQIALAADEAGLLDRFYCSLYNGPRCFGGELASVFGARRLASRHADGLNTSKVEEYPWPLLWHELSGARDWFKTNDRFDRHVASRLDQCGSKIFVGVETCTLRSFEIGKKQGLRLILDCPGFESSLRDELAKQAAREFQLDEPHPSDSLEILRWKESEIAFADYLLVYSSVHRESLLRRGAVASKFIEIPLWADCDFWYPPPKKSDPTSSALKVLSAGGITLRKGIPYLLAAANECGPAVDVTLAGTVADEIKPVLAKYRNHRLLPHQNRAALRDLCWRSDVLVLPSLGESWGFVALEAMLCGLPVIVTENCGAPVPDDSWRVPVMDSRAIAERLLLYANDRILCREHGSIAVPFARQFTPERYRKKLTAFFQKVLDES